MREVRFLRPALSDLERLDKSIARRVMARLDWLAINFDRVN
jgi:hypothetical protein